MKKRLLSLLLAVVLCIGLLPVGALAADGDVTIKVDGVDEETGDINESDGGQRTGPVLTSSDTNLSGQFYIVQGDVTINGDLTVDGSKIGGLVLCADATLTVTGALIYSGGSWFSIYGQTRQGSSQSTGKLIIENSNGDGAAIRSTASSAPSLNISSGKVEIYGGKSEKLINGVYLTSTSSVHKVTLDGETASPETLGSSSLNGKTLVLEYCEHPFDDYVWIKDSNTQHHWACIVCGFVSSAKDPHSVVLPVAWTETTHTLRCEYCDYTADPAKHDFTKLQFPEVSSDGKGHVSEMCEACGYTSGTAEPHHYGTDGSCDTCGFLPVFEDGAGNLYAYNGSDSIMKLNEAIEKGATYFKLVNFATGDNADTTTVNACFSLETDKSVTLDMNGYTLENGGAPVITVEAGTLNITGAAVISQAAKSKELVAPAIKVTGGALTFDNVVTATGSAADSSAAPAILIGGGTVAFEQDVTATAVENAGLYTAIAPAIKVTGGKAVFNGKVTATGGLGGVSQNTRPCEPAIYANGGELDFNGDLDLNGGLTITGDAKLTKGLTRGTFKVDYTGERVNGNRVSVVGSANYKNLNSLLAADRAFVSEDETRKYPCVGDNNRSWGGDVTIQEHTHVYNPAENYTCECGVSCDHSAGYENGKCKTCGKPCSHLRLGTGDRDCLDCGQRMIARIITKNNEGYDLPTYYSDLPTALNAAKNGETVTLLDNIDQSNKTACLTGDGKTVTLNLNGKNITGGWIYVGIDQDGTVINSSRLNITGSGSFDGMIGISAKGTLDLSAWDGGTIRTVDLSKSGDDECKLIVGEKAGTIQTLKIYNWPTDQNSSITYINKTKLRGGSYDNISITMKSENGATRYIPYGSMLAPGYAFQYTDSGAFVDYAAKAEYGGGGSLSNVKVVRCTSHVDADGNNLCDYCNTDLAAGVAATLETGGATYYYTDLPSALKAASSKGGTVTLQKDVENVSQMLVIEGSLHVTLDLNGKKITGDGSSTLLGISNLSDVTICDSSESKAGQIKCTASGYAVYVSEGCDLTISGGTFEGTDGATTSAPGYAVGVDGAKLIITGGTFNSPVDAKDKLIVSGGTFNSAVTITVARTEIKGGTFNGAFTMSAQPDVFSGGMFKEQASFSNVSNILTGGTFEKGLSTTSSWPGLASLLKRNYKYKTTGGWHYLDGVYNVTDNVTVAEVPIHSPVSLIAYPGSKEYGKSQDITLSASCGGSAEDLYVGWFLVHEDGTQDLVSNGGKGLTKVENKSATYTLPAGLAIGRHTYRVFFCDKNVQDGENTPSDAYIETADITITVTKIDIANVPEDQIELELVYGGNVPYNINGATNADGVHATTMALSPVEPFKVNGIELTEKDYTLEGNVQYGVGEYTLKINVDTAIYTGSIERTWHVIPRKLGLPGFLQGDYEKTYDGETALPKGITYCNGYFEPAGKDYFLSPTNLKPSDYTLTNESFENATVGEDKRISFTLQLTNKNYEFNTSYIEGLAKDGVSVTADSITYTNCIMPRSVHFNITPDTMPDFDKEVTLDIVNGLAHTYTIDLLALPALESPRTYGDTQYEVDQSSVNELTQGYNAIQDVGFAVNPDNGKTQLTFHAPAVENQTEGSVGAIKITVTPTNYKPVTLTVNLRSVNKRKLGMFVSVATDPVVYGMTLGDIKLSAKATDGGQVIPGTIAWEDPLTTVPAAGQATYRWTFTPDDTMQYLTASSTISFSVDKATPTGAPTYTAITTGGKTLADAALAANESWPVGTLQWVDKDGKALDAAATEVKANTAYQWKFTPDSKNYDPIEGSITLYSVSTGGGGSTTYPVSTPSKTENGSVSVSPKNASRGDTVTITVKPNDGYILDDLAVTDKNGNDLKLTDKGNGKYTFTMPAGKVEVKASFAEEAETSPFADVATNAYYYEAVKWAAEQGITGGIGNNLFGPNQPCTRAQIVTFLWRAAGSPEPKDMSSFADVSTDSYYAKAVAWAVENGITSGTGDGKFSPDATCTRAQAVMFLARALNAKATSAAEFSDVPTDSYFAEAVAWAASNGVTAGIGGGLFGPNNDCTRAQIVTFLFRAYNK